MSWPAADTVTVSNPDTASCCLVAPHDSPDTASCCLVAAHDRPELLVAACDLMNAEWPRSRTARLRSLTASRQELPTSLLLLAAEAGGEGVIGHVKLSALPARPAAVFVESVVVAPRLRGRGLGRIIMTLAEEYAVRRGFDVVYLNTHDKQQFYARLGYSVCEPVQTYGGPMRSSVEALAMQDNVGITTAAPLKPTESFQEGAEALVSNGRKTAVFSCSSVPPVFSPGPPPPPLPPISSTTAKPIVQKVFMVKNLQHLPADE